MEALNSYCPCFYWTIAVLCSLLFGFRGWVYQRYDPYLKSAEKAKPWEQVLVNNGHDAFYNFICSMAGFSALKLLARFLTTIRDLSTISGGAAATLAFLTLVSILGIGGVLPRFFYRGAFVGKTE